MSSLTWRELWTEHRPTPKPMTDTEILDWLNEYCDGYTYTFPTNTRPSKFTVTFYDATASGKTLREAVCNAAAIWKEMNK